MFRKAKRKLATLMESATHYFANLVHRINDVCPEDESPMQAVLTFFAMLAALACLLTALVLASPICS